MAKLDDAIITTVDHEKKEILLTIDFTKLQNVLNTHLKWLLNIACVLAFIGMVIIIDVL